MRNRSSLYSLMAKRVAAKKADAVKEMRRLHDAHSRAEVLSNRLREILDERAVSGPVLAAQLRSASTLNTKIAAEAVTQNQRKAELSDALDRSRLELARQDYKSKFLLDAAAQARAEEDREAENRAEANRPQPRR